MLIRFGVENHKSISNQQEISLVPSSSLKDSKRHLVPCTASPLGALLPAFDSAVEQCRSRGIKVARSNTCFEVWLILHVEDYHRPDDSKAVQRHLTNLCLGYDRRGGKSLDCTQLLERIEDAERRAERQLEESAKEGKAFGRPCTTVFQLTRSIRKAALDSVRK